MTFKPSTISRIIGILSILSGALLTIYNECPTKPQLFILYTLIGLGLGFLFTKSAERTQASFKLWNISVVLLGGVALPFILFFTNPIEKFKNDPCYDPTSVSVFVHGKNGRQDMVLRKQGYIIMDVKGGERKKEEINEKGFASFQNLHIGDSVRIDVDFSEPYKSIWPDSIFVINRENRIYLQVTLKGINQVAGRVIYNDSPIEGVIVTINMLTDTTDVNGRYQINIPEAEQKKQYEVWFNKKGFKLKSASAFPQTGQDLNIVMEK